MNRIDRLSAILIQLQSKKVVKAQEIADRFDISLRTVYRDIRALEEGGVPIGAEAGVGYFLNSDFHLPPVMFTKDEASAFVLAEKLIRKMSDAKVSKAFESALFKVKSVLKISEKEYLDNLSDKIAVFSQEPHVNKESDLYLFDMQKALANKQLIEIEYVANYNGKCTKRILEPVSLCNYGMRWHLIAYCKLRGDYRDFRLDRIVSAKLLEENYSCKNHLSLEEYFAKVSRENSLYPISLKVEKSIHEYLKSSKYWFGLLEEIEDDDFYLMKFANADLNLFAKWVLSMEDKVEIIRPIELKNIVAKDVEILVGYYNLIN